MFSIFKNYPGLFVSFSKKIDGSMKLTDNPNLKDKIFQNRNDYFEKINIDPQKIISAEIVHGNEARIVKLKDSGNIIIGADGLITKDKNIYSSITSADCLPIFLFDLKKEILGVVHAGWRSLEMDILANAVGKIVELGGNPKNILAGIGPAICPKHYEVGLEVANKFAKYPNAIKKVSLGLIRRERENDKYLLDIKKVAQLQLLKSGLSEKNIEISSECTFELPEKYFSARRDKKKEIEAMIAVIGMKSL